MRQSRSGHNLYETIGFRPADKVPPHAQTLSKSRRQMNKKECNKQHMKGNKTLHT